MDIRKFKSVIMMMIKGQVSKVYERPICEKCVEAIYSEVCEALPFLVLTKIVEHAHEAHDLDSLKQALAS
jgi:hypothetical protein